MNTKILQRLSTIIAILLVIPLTIISLAASVSNATENEDEKPENDEPKTTQNKIVDGIYRFDGELTLSNITYFIDEDELFDYFETKDINGVKNAALSMGYSTFTNNLVTADGKEKFIEFKDENYASSYTKENDTYALLNEIEFEFTYQDSEYVSTGINPIIKNDAENKTVTLYFPFYIENEDGTKEITPLYVEAKLVFVDNSK